MVEVEEVGIDRDKITSLEIDLIDACNLSCPLCNRSRFDSKSGYLDIEEWKKIILKYKLLDEIYFIGVRGEPTLYPGFLGLCKWIKKKGIKIIISTNGSTKDEMFWKNLGMLLAREDEVRFCIDGATQASYEKYRVGGSLSRILANHKNFCSDEKNDCLQVIRFEHNKNDDFSKLKGTFNRYREINSSFNGGDSEIVPLKSDLEKFDAIKTYGNKKTKKIKCINKNYENFINYNGDESPCCHYNEWMIMNNTSWDGKYKAIENGEFDFCTIICDSGCSKMMKSVGLSL